MNHVRVGQVWSCNSNRFAGRIHFTVTDIDLDAGEAIVRFHGAIRPGISKVGRKKLRTLRLGLAGARIERTAGGRAGPHRRALRLQGPTAAERSTASDHRKVAVPRGLTRAERERFLRTGELGEVLP